MRAEPGLLRKDRDICVAQTPAQVERSFPDRFEQDDAVGILVTGIGIGKMAAEVAVTKRPENRISERVSYDVGIRMPAEPMRMGNLHAAENQPAARFQRMEIETLADSKAHR